MSNNPNAAPNKYLSTEKWNVYNREYRKAHPEQAMRWRLAGAVRLLEKHGYTVQPPEDESEGATE